VNAANGLPAGPAAQLLDAARESFTVGLNAAAGVGAFLFVALAVLATVLLRHVEPFEKTAEVDEAEATPVAAEASPQP
jgi:MFS transporter, DHA2 family, multidrug resistance protein